MYKNVWLGYLEIRATEGKRFNDLLDLEDTDSQEYIGAWGNILIISDRINEVPDIIEAGLNELGMTVVFIDKIENVNSLVEDEQLSEIVIEEANWLLASKYVFKICNKLFPYIE